VPATGPLAEAGRAVVSLLTAYFDSINTQGGIYNRRLELTPAALGDSTSDAEAGVETLMRSWRPFAMVAGVMTGVEKPAIAAVERNRIPFVGPLTVFPDEGLADARTFYLLSGVEQQARALIDYGAWSATGAGRSMAIVYSEGVTPPPIVSALQEYGRRAGWGDVAALSRGRGDASAHALADALHRAHATHILLIADGGETRDLAAAIATLAWTPTPVLLVPGSMATNDIMTLPAAFADHLLLALPSLPTDQTQAGHAEYRALADTYRLSDDQMAFQIAALCSAKVLTHALKLAGRSLSREKLVAALEGLRDFDTGLMPRVGFGPNRRVGAPGAYIVTVDPNAKRFTQLTGWLGVE